MARSVYRYCLHDIGARSDFFLPMCTTSSSSQTTMQNPDSQIGRNRTTAQKSYVLYQRFQLYTMRSLCLACSVP